MREDLLHYIWRFKKYPKQGLKSTKGEDIAVLDAGNHNHLSGPDFFNARIRIAEQLWAGNVEIHINASDWYAHNHQEDKNYDNVILHVVWTDDVAVFRSDGTEIPTLELKNFIDSELLIRYRDLMDGQSEHFINCGKDILEIPKIKFENWQDRLYLERLEAKSEVILELLQKFGNDWEKVLFILLLKNFGSKVNGEAFYQLGMHLDFATVRHLVEKPIELESLLLGMAGLLDYDTFVDPYFKTLRDNYRYFCHKYDITGAEITTSFFKLRPPNFPTIRLSQFAALYAQGNNIFNELMYCDEARIYDIFNVKASSYWDDHYNFGKISRVSPKRLTRTFVELLIINTIIPLRFCYQKYRGTPSPENVLSVIKNVGIERNVIIDNFMALGVQVESAWGSQSLLQLYNNYCTQNKCLQCVVGATILNLKS